jgi:hexosaminidase
MRKIILLFLPLWAIAAENPIHIIPEPAQVSQREGFFKIVPTVKILLSTTDSAFRKITQDFANEFSRSTGLRLHVVEYDSSDSDSNIVVQQLPGQPREGYRIDIASKRVIIDASDPAGLFYALQSLRQLLPVEFYSKKKKNARWYLPNVSITDYPRYGYRGMHLDVSRHFFPTSYIKKYLDILAFYKINTFHWHLTDSHGWRLEIKKYPKLTSVGAWRADRSDIPFTIAEPTGKDEKATYGGFYTQEQVKEVIQYAAERFITIIPEIEMPGHCTAALVAYPEYTCLNNPAPLLIPCGYPGDLKHNFCPGNDSTFTFLQNILDEVMALFPSEYIHIGGDEVRPASWLNCPRCQQRMKELNITTGKQLQSYFTKRIDDYITSRNRKLIGWDEIMEAGISHNAAVMSWRGNEGGIAAARDSHHVVMAPYRFVYFDFYQSPPALEPDISYAGLSIDKVYSFEPTPAELDTQQMKYILGGQACLWTENVRTPQRLEYMLLPRMLALSEVLWTPAANKDYPKFVDKVEKQFTLFDRKKINYAKSMYNVSIDPVFDSATKTIKVALNAQTGDKYLIRYCTRATAPDCMDPIYTGPLELKDDAEIKAGLFNEDTLLGMISEDKISFHHGLGAKIPDTFKKLADGIHGTIEPYDGRWVFFSDSLLDITIDLKESKSIDVIQFRCLEDMVGNALLPESVEVAVSSDGSNYSTVYSITNNKIPEQKTRHIVEYEKDGLNTRGRYVKFTIKASDYTNPENPSPNSIFIDELVIE